MMIACIITTYTMLNVPSVEKAPRIIHRQKTEQLKNGTGEQTMEHKCKKTDLKTVEKCELNAEQIVKALECCHTPLASDCNDCGYRGQSVENGEYIGCSNRLMADALALIKELT
jgi:hypothetical protein